MKKDVDKMWDAIKNSSGKKQVGLFLEYCDMLVKLKDAGSLNEEEVGYKIVDAYVHFDNLSHSPACEKIFDVAGEAELPRTMSYIQPIGKWDAKIADQIKREEWEALVCAIEDAKISLNIG